MRFIIFIVVINLAAHQSYYFASGRSREKMQWILLKSDYGLLRQLVREKNTNIESMMHIIEWVQCFIHYVVMHRTTKFSSNRCDVGSAIMQLPRRLSNLYYSNVTMSAMAAPITGVSVVCTTVCSGADQRKHQSSASLAFVRGINRWPVNSPHKGPVTGKMFLFDDVIM